VSPMLASIKGQGASAPQGRSICQAGASVHRCSHPCGVSRRPGRVWHVPLPAAAGRPGRPLSATRSVLAKRMPHASAWQPEPCRDRASETRGAGARGERGDGQPWPVVAGGAEDTVVTGDDMEEAPCERNGWHGEKPTDVEADRVRTVSTSLDRSSAASIGRRAARHLDEVRPLPHEPGRGLDLSSFS